MEIIQKLQRASRLSQLGNAYRSAAYKLENIAYRLREHARYYDGKAAELTTECQKEVPGIWIDSFTAGEVPADLVVKLFLKADSLGDAVQRGLSDRTFAPDDTQPLEIPPELAEYWRVRLEPPIKPAKFDFSSILQTIQNAARRA